MTFAYRAEVHAIAAAHRLDPDLVEAVCLVESSGRTSAYRYEPGFFIKYLANKPQWDGSVPERISASYGLMQCMYPVALELGMPPHDPPEYLFVPVYGLQYGCRKLRETLNWSKGDVPSALAAYNGGRVGNRPGGPLRNQAYVTKVLRQLELLRP